MGKIKLDLTELNDFASMAEMGNESNGAPLELPIEDVIEDPDQPRKYFSEESINSMAAQILASKSKKIRSPISVKPKNADGKWVINHGARRYRSTIRAGQPTIPGFIDKTHDDYDQVAENLQREDLAPLEIAMFIQKRIAKGDKKGDIATKLGQKASFISEHLPLVDAPEFIQTLARDKSVGVRTLYDLIKAYAEFPEAVETFVRSGEEVTRAGVKSLIDQLKAAISSNIQNNVAATVDSKTESASDTAPVIEKPSVNIIVKPPKVNNSTSESAEKLTKNVSKAHSKKLTIVIKNGDRIATLLPKHKVEVMYKDTGEIAKVDLASIEIIGTEVFHEIPETIN